MNSLASPSVTKSPIKWIFITGFVLACFLFWWLPNVLYRFVLGIDDPVENWAIWVSVLALGAFILGYFIKKQRPSREMCAPVDRDVCAEWSYRASLLLAVPSFVVAGQFAIYRSSLAYTEGSGIPLAYQAVLYTHLFFALLFIGASSSRPEDRRRITIVSTIVVLPRLAVSLHWGRYFLAQSVVPIVLIALARNWIRLSWSRALLLSAGCLFIIVVPALTRGDRIFGEDDSGQYAAVNFFQQGSTLKFLQDYKTMDLGGKCPPLFVSFAAKVIPFSLLGVCTIDVGDVKNIPAILDVLITHETSDDLLRGSGSNYVLELYLTGGLLAVVIGSALFGWVCRTFLIWISRPSIYAGIWAECLMRAFMTPRGALGYVFERVPSLLLATFLTAALCRFMEATATTPKTLRRSLKQ
jgi:hypothetical protein